MQKVVSADLPITIAELVRVKKHSDWLPGRTAKMDHLRLNVRLKGAKCFNLTENKAKMF